MTTTTLRKMLHRLMDQAAKSKDAAANRMDESFCGGKLMAYTDVLVSLPDATLDRPFEV